MNPTKSIILINTGVISNLLIVSLKKRQVHYPPFGLLSLEMFLKMHGYRVKIIDLLSTTISRETLTNEIILFEKEPLVIGISSYTENFPVACNLIKYLKSVFKKTKFIIGGPHVSFLPEEVLGLGVDYVIRFEGESTLITLLEYIKYPNSLPIEKVEGIAYKKNGKIHINPKRKFITNLNFLPFSSNFFSTEDESDRLLIVTSRGCPGRCIFCASGAYSGRKFRKYSAEWIFSYIYYFKTQFRKITSMEFIDDTFTVDKKRLKKILFFLGTLGLNLSWHARSRILELNEPFIKFLAKNSCQSLHLGVESADQGVLDSINKSFSIAMFLEIMESLVEAGIYPRCSFMIGHHTDTLETIEKTLILAVEIETKNIGRAVVAISTPFPGTILYNQASKLGIEIKNKKWRNYTFSKPIYSTKNFQISDLRKALYIYQNEKGKIRNGPFLSNSELKDFREKIAAWIRKIEKKHHKKGMRI